MKDRQINLRTSENDLAELDLAKRNLQDSTGKKLDLSKTIRQSIKQAAENEPDLFFVNRPALREVDNNISVGLKLLQAVVDQFSSIDLPVSVSDIAGFYGTGRMDFMTANQENVREFIITRLFDRQKDLYPGLTFERANVDLPDMTELLSAISALSYIPDVQLRETGVYWNCYTITSGKVTVIAEAVESIKDGFRAYATTPDERRKLAKARKLCQSLNEFIKGETLEPEKLNIPAICYFDNESARYEPSEQFVRFGIEKKYIF